MLCEHCGKKLVAIGNRRKNGKSHDDWDSRKYHKKCWLVMLEYRRLEIKYKANVI